MNPRNFFKYLESKRGVKLPLIYKIIHEPETIEKEDLIVKGDFRINKSSTLKSLPNNLYVGGDFVIYDCPNLTALPDNLTVRGVFFIMNCEIASIGKNTRLGSRAYITMCPITDISSLKMIDGDLCISHSQVKKLPDDFLVRGNLDMMYTPISDIPDRLRVYGNMYIEGSGLISTRFTLPSNRPTKIEPIYHSLEEVASAIRQKGGEIRGSVFRKPLNYL
jgi:hypothetical protein